MSRKKSALDHAEPPDPRSIRCPTCKAFAGRDCVEPPATTIDVDLWIGGRAVAMSFHASRVSAVHYGEKR